MKTGKPLSNVSQYQLWHSVVGGLFGLFLAVALLKWGNPVILDDPAIDQSRRFILPDESGPTNLRYWLLGVLTIGGLAVASWKTTAPRWIVALPLCWLIWQFVAASRTVDVALTQATLKHFCACVACFYLGLFSLSRARNVLPFAILLSAGLLVVLWTGLGQHYGGLESTRQFYEKLYRREHPPEIQNELDTPQFRQMFSRPEFQKRIASDRIFGTLLYPNALAGSIILILPASLVALGQTCRSYPFLVRGVLIGLFGYAGLACLYWSGSKAGWLIALLLSLISVLRQPFQPRLKAAILTIALITGVIGFFVKFSDYFQRGATSVGARFDYWRAALQIASDNPVSGSGPGTFSVLYKRIKAPESEMAQLTHNDYLEQASDSGILGFVAYAVMIFGSLAFLYRHTQDNSLQFAVWLGLVGWAVQGFVEFGLYIPALAWPAFSLLGWLGGSTSK